MRLPTQDAVFAAVHQAEKSGGGPGQAKLWEALVDIPLARDRVAASLRPLLESIRDDASLCPTLLERASPGELDDLIRAWTSLRSAPCSWKDGDRRIGLILDALDCVNPRLAFSLVALDFVEGTGPFSRRQ